MPGISAVASLMIASSPVTRTTGTRKLPATAALTPASGTETPFMRMSAMCAEDIVCARTPDGFVVDE